MSAKKTKGEKREEKRKPKMNVSGKSVFNIKKIIQKDSNIKPAKRKLTK